MPETEGFQPDWASPPGDTILEILAQKGIPLAEFARQINESPDRADKLTRGEKEIDQTLAEQLEIALGPSTAFWINRENQYRFDAIRLTDSPKEMTEREWMRLLPVSDMIKFGWIEGTKSFENKMDACLQFFEVTDISTWHQRYQGELTVAAFRTSSTFQSNPFAVSAWLRWAELKSEKIICESWDKEKFTNKLPEMRALSRRKVPARFLKDLRALCAQCGVALVIAPAPSGCRASGATRFLTSDKAMIALSLRHRTDDHFWFTFFHEAGHLIIHGKDALFIEDESGVTPCEDAEANEFAEQILVPQKHVSALMHLRPSTRELIRFARKVGVSPGIIVGQLQHRQRIGHNRYNSLKRRFAWSSLDLDELNL